MKTAKPSAGASETLPGRRSQPVRQTRTNPPRASGVVASSGRNGGREGRDSISGAAGHEQPSIDIFPGVTHFADAITALPKELVRHFTLLKEVDAKIHVPQQSLFRLVNAALRMPAPNSTRSPYDGSNADTPKAAADAAAAAAAATGSVSVNNGKLAPLPRSPPAASSLADQSAYNESNQPRRQLFRQVASEIRDMLVALEEKKHVISTANDALNKQLARIDDIWPHLEQEFSDEAKWGSTMHWAYPENRAGLANNNALAAERSRRDGAASLSAAAQQIADEAAARSDARKQAVAARRNQKVAAHLDADADDLQQAKKAGGGPKSRKIHADSAASVGLGIAAVGANGSSSATSKRRKTEKPAASSAPMERALSGVFGAGAGSGSKARTSSPRGSPAPDGGRKRKALPTGGNQTKKSRGGTSATSSPVIGASADVKTVRNLPPPFPTYASESLNRMASNGGASSRSLGVSNKISTGSNTRPDEIMIDAPANNESSPFSRPAPVPEIMGPPSSFNGTGAGHGVDKPINSSIGIGRSSLHSSGILHSNNSGSNRSGNLAANGLSTPLTTPSHGGPQDVGVARDVSDSRNASGREMVTTSALLPSLRDNGPHGPRLGSAVQMMALDPTRQRRSSPLSMAVNADSRQINSSPLSTVVTAADTLSYANGLRTPAVKSTKEAVPVETTTAAATPAPVPVPTPIPSSTHAPDAALLLPPVPTAQTAQPAQPAPAPAAVAASSAEATGALKTEPTESNNGAALAPVAMTRTRSASLLEGKKEKDTKDGVASNGAGATADKVSPDDEVGKKERTPVAGPGLTVQTTASSSQAAGVTAKSGRASKPSTPAHSTFAEASLAGAASSSSRPARAADAGGAAFASGSGSTSGQATGGGGSSTTTTTTTTSSINKKNSNSNSHSSGSGNSSSSSSSGGSSNGSAAASTHAAVAAAATAATTAYKRSHKKGASSVSAHQTQHGQAPNAHARSQSASQNSSSSSSHRDRSGAGDETRGSGWQAGGSGGAKSKQQQQQKQQEQQSQEEDEDDPLYCYCNRVSFGEMIACDAADCKREWFHLECVGLRVAPKSSVKWYCDDCKKRLRAHERKSSNR